MADVDAPAKEPTDNAAVAVDGQPDSGSSSSSRGVTGETSAEGKGKGDADVDEPKTYPGVVVNGQPDDDADAGKAASNPKANPADVVNGQPDGASSSTSPAVVATPQAM